MSPARPPGPPGTPAPGASPLPPGSHPPGSHPPGPPGTTAPGASPPPPGEHPPGEHPTGEHPTAGIDDTVHQRHRLGILTITAEAQRADFGQLRAALGLTPGNLSRHLTVLEEADLVQVEKGYEGRRPRTWVRITGQGRKALAAELSTLTELVRRHAASAPANGQD
ncbi:MAG TPA: transcriptional regulator [Streptosporangiaceae bacterium]